MGAERIPSEQLAELRTLRCETEYALRHAYDPKQVWELYVSLRDINAAIDQLERSLAH